jgi:uncharacterized membrane protein
MLSELFEITLVAATLATGLVAGVFLTFSDFVMRGLGRAQPAAGIEAMQWINREVYRSLFMVLLIGMSVASLGLAVLGAVLIGGTVTYWLAAAGALYVLGVMAVTGRRNVPMNKRLDHVEHRSAHAQDYWNTYQRDWTRWNHLRWATALAASVCYLGAALTLAGTA